jgi:hypothetical protein
VIAFVASKYRERYSQIWREFLELSDAPEFPLQSALAARFVCYGRESLSLKTPISTARRAERKKDDPGIHLVSTVAMESPECCVPVMKSDLRATYRNWVGNDKNQNRHHGIIPMSESPVDIRLGWKSSTDAPVTPIGCSA